MRQARQSAANAMTSLERAVLDQRTRVRSLPPTKRTREGGNRDRREGARTRGTGYFRPAHLLATASLNSHGTGEADVLFALNAIDVTSKDGVLFPDAEHALGSLSPPGRSASRGQDTASPFTMRFQL